MTRLRLLAAVALVVLTAGPASAAEEVVIRDIDSEKFPKIEITVATDEKTAQRPETIQVSEDGVELESRAEPLTESVGEIDVVLVIDTSGSMVGEPIAAALAAARSFVTDLPEEIPLGVVGFSDRPRVVAPITTDHARALGAIDRLRATGDTVLYGGVSTAARMFTSDAQHNMVVLSDGGDTASTTTLRAATKLARSKGVTIYPVGLRSGEFDAAALRTLARGTGGQYAEADTADLTTVYEGLAEEISNQFVVRYTSAAEPGTQFTVEVVGVDSSDSALLLAPDIEVAPAPKPTPVEEEADPFLEGAVGKMVVLGLTFMGVFLLAMMFVGAQARRRRDQELTRRVGNRGEKASGEHLPETSMGWVPDQLMEVATKLTEGERGSRMDRKLEQAGWTLRSSEYLVANIMLGILAGVGAALLFKNVLLALILGVIAARIPSLVLSIAANKRHEKIQSQLPDILMVLASSLRAGYSFLQALDAVSKEVSGPGGQEFSRVVAEIRLGRSVDEAMNDVATRVDSEDLRWAVLAVNIQRDVGGNLAELLDTVANTIREREQIRRQVKVLSAEGRLSMIILCILPIATGTWIAIINPEYFSLMYETRAGLVMLGLSACLMGLGIFWMQKVIKIDV